MLAGYKIKTSTGFTLYLYKLKYMPANINISVFPGCQVSHPPSVRRKFDSLCRHLGAMKWLFHRPSHFPKKKINKDIWSCVLMNGGNFLPSVTELLTALSREASRGVMLISVACDGSSVTKGVSLLVTHDFRHWLVHSTSPHIEIFQTAYYQMEQIDRKLNDSCISYQISSQHFISKWKLL